MRGDDALRRIAAKVVTEDWRGRGVLTELTDETEETRSRTEESIAVCALGNIM